MSQRKKFSIPFKSPGWRAQGAAGTAAVNVITPKNIDTIGTPKAPKKIKQRHVKKSKEDEPRTPSFKLYGIKSPCRRKIILDDSTRYSLKSPKHLFVHSSQNTTPGRTPGQLIPNFRSKIQEEREILTPARSSYIDPDENLNSASVRKAHRKLLQSIQQDDAKENVNYTRNEQEATLCVYDLPLSPESQYNIATKRKRQIKEERAKQYVLKVLRQTKADLKELRKKHRKILREIEAKTSNKEKVRKREATHNDAQMKFTVTTVSSQRSEVLSQNKIKRRTLSKVIEREIVSEENRSSNHKEE